MKELIAKQLLDGTIEFLSSPKELDALSTVTMRSGQELGLRVLNATWCYSPKYIQEHVTKAAYTFGQSQPLSAGGYQELLNSMLQKAEQEFYYGPLQRVRKFLIRKDADSGATNLLLPEQWRVTLDDTLSSRDFLALIESYVRNSPSRQAITSVIYEQFYSDKQNTKRAMSIVCAKNLVVLLGVDSLDETHNELFDMAPVLRFIAHPNNHKLTQEVFKAYRALVNL